MVYLPLAQNYTRFGLGVIEYWGIAMMLSILVIYPKTYLNKYLLYVIIYWLLFYFFTFVIWNNVDEWNLRVVRNEALWIIFPVVMFSYFSQTKDYKGYTFLVKWALTFTAITAIFTIYTTLIDPMYVRIMTAGEFSSAELIYIRSFGGGGYSFAATLLFPIPILVYLIRKAKNKYARLLFIVFLAICFTAIVRMQIFVNILTAAIILIISLGGSKNIKLSLTYVTVVLLVLFVLPLSNYIYFLEYVSGYFSPDSATYEKINDLSKFFQFGMTATDTGFIIRYERYPMLLKAFFNSPILGQYSKASLSFVEEGGHLYWMNKLAIFGSVNYIFFVLIFYYYFKITLKLIDNEFKFYFILSSITGLSYGITKTIVGWDYWCMLFFVLPGFHFYFHKNEIFKMKTITNAKNY